MKNFSVDYLASLNKSVTTITNCAKIIRKDGVTYRFTSLDKDLLIDGELYKSSYSFNPTAYTSALGLEIENMEIEGALDSLNIIDFDIIKGLFYGAEVWFFSLDYKNIAAGKDKILYGTVGEIELTDKQFLFEVRGMTKKYETLYAQYYGKICRARLGDSRCQVNLNNHKVIGTVNLDSGSTATILTTYLKLSLLTDAWAFNNLRLHDIYVLNNVDTVITPESISLVTSVSLACADGIEKNINNLIDYDPNTFVCFDIGYDSMIPSAIIIKYPSTVTISKLVIRDNVTINGGKKINVVYASYSTNGFTWTSLPNITTSGYRTGDIITIPYSTILTPDGTNRYRFTSNDVASSGKPENYFQYGNLKWLTGLNAGLQTEVVQSDTGGHVELAIPMPNDIQNGDTFEITAGCNHLLVGKDGSYAAGHCKTKFNNVVNFRGEPYLPNEDVLLSGYIAVKEARQNADSEEGPVSLEPVI